MGKVVDKYDFSGWATRNDLLCADGRTIRKNAFATQDGSKVPLVWNHQHNSPGDILGHAILENRDDGVYAYGYFNDSESGRQAREDVMHGDISSLSIYANRLKQSRNGDVFHGTIREVSLVYAGANPGAYIDAVISHGSDDEEGIEVCYNEHITVFDHFDDDIQHSEKEEEPKEQPKEEKPEEKEDKKEEKKDMAEKTLGDVIETLNEEQKEAVYALLGLYAQQNEEDDEEDEDMKHNAFDRYDDGYTGAATLSHSDFNEIMELGKRFGSLKEGWKNFAEENCLQHDDPAVQTYGIQDVDYLFPDAKNLNMPPEFIGRNTDWVAKVIGGIHHIPFSRVKMMFADITEDAARAKGYIKGSLKKEEVFSLLKRKIEPTTVYKKQKMDRDDLVDITEFDVLQWLKVEMRMMLNEEIARAVLFGDGRLTSDEDHIDATRIIPVINDADLFTIRWSVAGDQQDETVLPKNMIRAAIKSRKNYRGSGNPIMFTTEDVLTDMLLLEDQIGHKLYKTEAELATALRVKEIVTVPVMENVTDKDNKAVYAVIVNLADYDCGADKGGEINFFDDFDIDYNQQKFLLETRCSGALVKPFSAIVLRAGSTTASEEPSMHDAMEPFKNPS
ncbi:MAG: HK97 family phage prohead protease [Clostridiales bacterium]|nr:HK97 family phage prohead protease [Clostridiales bacterium]